MIRERKYNLKKFLGVLLACAVLIGIFSLEGEENPGNFSLTRGLIGMGIISPFIIAFLGARNFNRPLFP